MSILIKGMEMPKNCGECPCYYDGYCHGIQYREEDEDYRAVSYKEYDKKRRNDCPLIELPPHGDLIDRDALSKSLDKLCDRICQYSKAQRNVMCSACPLGNAFIVVEDDAPPIIESEE